MGQQRRGRGVRQHSQAPEVRPILQVATKPTKVLGLAFGARGLVCPTTRRAAKEIKIRTLHGWLLAHWSAASFV